MRTTRKTLEPGIYQDRFGLAAVVTVAGRRKEHRWPPGTPLQLLRTWRLRTKLELEQAGPGGLVRRGTLAADVARYLRQVQTLTSWRELRSELRAWTALYGTLPRWRLNAEHVRLARVDWQRAGVAPKTINNRVDALRRLYRLLDATRDQPRPPTPCDAILPLPVARPRKTPVDSAVIVAVARELEARETTGVLRSAKTRARFLVLATTGVRPVELMRAQPDDVQLDTDPPHWVTRDAKGGRRLSALPLNADMLAAWRLFVAADAWGRYETSAMARTLRSAGWPQGVPPYRLRATVGITLSEHGIDLADVAGWLGHTELETTRAHYVPLLDARLVAAAGALQGRFGHLPVAPPVAPARKLQLVRR